MHQRSVLNNGLSVLTTSMPGTSSVSVGFFIGAGSRYESDQIAGVSHFLEHLLFKGTKNWPTAKELSEAIEGVGGIMNASTDREMTVYWCKVAKPHFQRAFSVLADMMLTPLIEPVELEKEREVVIEELRMTNDYPTNRLELLMDETLWPDQPMGRDVGGSIDTVRGIGRDQVLEYMERQYTPGNTALAVAGEIEHDDVVAIAAQHFNNWQPKEPMDWYPVRNGQQEPRVRTENRKTDQVHLNIGLPGLPLTHPDRYALGLMNVILGEGMSSRLFLELRENQSLAYDVHSSLSFFRDCGALTVYCGVEPKKSQKAIKAIIRELKGIQGQVSESEMYKAKELTKGRMLLRMEDTRNVAMWMGAQEALVGRVRTVDEVLEQVDKVSMQDVDRVAGDIIREDKLNLAVVGPHRSDRRFRSLLKLPA